MTTQQIEIVNLLSNQQCIQCRRYDVKLYPLLSLQHNQYSNRNVCKKCMYLLTGMSGSSTLYIHPEQLIDVLIDETIPLCHDNPFSFSLVNLMEGEHRFWTDTKFFNLYREEIRSLESLFRKDDFNPDYIIDLCCLFKNSQHLIVVPKDRSCMKKIKFYTSTWVMIN